VEAEWLHTLFGFLLFILGKMDEKIGNALYLNLRKKAPSI